MLSLGSLHFARFTSYLPGPIDIENLSTEKISKRNNNVDINIELYGSDEHTKNMALLAADDLLAVRDALNYFLPFTMNRLRLRVIMVPDGLRYVKTKTAIFSGSNVSAEFAVRVNADSNTSRRGAIRDIAHELMHVMFAINGISSKGAKLDGGSMEEEAAYTTENCVELRIIGSTAADPTPLTGFDASRFAPSVVVTSLASRQRIGAALAELFAQDTSPITTDDPRAEKLEALCRDAIDRLVTATDTHG